MLPDRAAPPPADDTFPVPSGLAVVIGLEIHVQLRTRTKMFCGDLAEYGAPPNTRVCPVCLGLPGALPVVNEAAVTLGARAALGLHCRVEPRSGFARKSYFYPDLPKGYQITQFDEPLARGGYLELPDGRRIRIRRLHLEEDTGKSLHDRIPGSTAIDLNRAGVPLIEIVTEPDLRSPAEARSFLVRLKRALEYLEVSDCNMEEGSLRVDANVSVHRPGEARGSRTEIKNLNSFGNLERALRFEIARQAGLLDAGRCVQEETLTWDPGRGEARAMRSKEAASDYRYLPEPDLAPLVLERELLEALDAGLPEMPWARARRFRERYGLSGEHADALCATRALADLFEAVVGEGARPDDAAAWTLGEVLATANERGTPVSSLGVVPGALAELLAMVRAGRVSRPVARRVFGRMLETGESVERIVEAEGLATVHEVAVVVGWVAEALGAHPDVAARYRAGEHRLASFLVGEVMRLAGGRADPRQVAAVLRRVLETDA